MIKILFSVGDFGGRADGVAEVVRELYRCAVADPANFAPEVLSMHCSTTPEIFGFHGNRIQIVSPQSKKLYRARFKAEPLRSIIHDHGQWLQVNRFVAHLSKQLNIPRITSTHGMLSPWALKHKRLKKILAWKLFGQRILENSAVVHATSELEYSELRALGVRRPIAIVQNGVPLPSENEVCFQTRKKQLLFLSRIHRKKGVRELLDAWKRCSATDWELIFAGPDEEGILKGSALPDNVRYLGPVFGADKYKLMKQASLFILPTHSENFGLVIAEAMSVGLPVITTRNAPWEVLNSINAGWSIDLSVENLKNTIQEAISTNTDDLFEMGRVGRNFILENYSWPSKFSQFKELYSWLAGEGSIPKFVRNE